MTLDTIVVFVGLGFVLGFVAGCWWTRRLAKHHWDGYIKFRDHLDEARKFDRAMQRIRDTHPGKRIS